MFKMCLNLINSQYKSISEVERLLNRNNCKLTEEDIIAIKDNREAIEKELRVTDQMEEIDILYS